MQAGKEETKESLDTSQGRSHSVPSISAELILSLDFQDLGVVRSFKQLNQDFTLHFRPTCSPAASVLRCMVPIHVCILPKPATLYHEENYSEVHAAGRATLFFI